MGPRVHLFHPLAAFLCSTLADRLPRCVCDAGRRSLRAVSAGQGGDGASALGNRPSTPDGRALTPPFPSEPGFELLGQ